MVNTHRTIYRREDARELLPEEKLSPLDLKIYEEARDKITTEVLREHIEDDGYIDDYRESFFEDAAIGDKGFLDLVRWYNSNYPDSAILIPSDYILNLAEVEEPDWLIAGLVLRNGLTLWYGDAGTYKTTSAIYMGYALMTGTDFFGIPVEGNYKVLYVEQDESPSILKQQIGMIGYPEEVFFCSKLSVIWSGHEFNQDFHNSLKALEPDVVFIDAYTSLGMEDITRPASALCLDALRRIASDYGISIIILHHTNLQGKQLGSSLHRAKIDSEMQSSVTTGEGAIEKVVITQGKVRGTHLEPIFLKANKETLHIERELNMNLTRMVREMMSAGQNQGEILSHFQGIQRASARRIFYRLTHQRNRTN